MKKELDFLAKRKIACGVLVFLAVTLLCLLTNLFSFYKSFLLGAFGLVSYPLIVLGMAYCVLFLMNRVVHFDKKTLVLGIITLSLFLCILQMALTSGLSFESFSAFIADSYNSKSTPGGALFSILVYPFKYLLFDIGAYIVFSIAIIALITYSVDSYYDRLKSQNKNAGARFDRYEQTPKDAVMELRASVDRISNTNYYKNQNMQSFNNQNAENFDNNYDNNYQGQNSFGNECKNQFVQTSNNENNQSVNMFESDKDKKDKLLTESVKAKLGLIDNGNEEYEQEECEDSKSVAFRTLYPDKCKDGKKASNFDKNNLGNSLSRYFDNNTSIKRESKEYKEKYKDYTTSKAQISYEYLNDDMKKNVQFDGIINGDEYKAKKTSSTIFSEKDKKSADNVINDLKSKPKVRIKVEEKRIGDCLIMSNVETYEDVESSAYSNGGDEVDKFATSNGGGNGVNKDYNEINNNANYINQNGIINASEYSSGNSARDYENNISANKYADLKTCNENSNSYKSVKEFESVNKKQKEIIKPILKVDDEVVNVSISTDFDSFGKASECNNDYQVEKEKRSTILPNSDDLTLNKDCQSENVKTDDEIIFNNFATHKEGEVDNKESKFNDFESERNSEENEFNFNNSHSDDESQNIINDNEEFDSNINDNQNQFNNAFGNNFEGCKNQNQFNANDNKRNIKVDDYNYSNADLESESDNETVDEDAGVNVNKFDNSNYNDNNFATSNNGFNASVNSVNNNFNGNNLHNSVNNEEVKANDFSNQNKVNHSFEQVNINKQNYQKVDEVKEEKKESVYEPPKPYNKPPIDLLTVESTDMSELVEDTVEKAEQLESALESFKVPAKVSNVIVGPAVTRYEMIMPAGISVRKILGYADDIAMTLKARGSVRIEAPIPGKNAVGIEVPNAKSATIGFKEVFESGEFEANKNPLNFVLGKDINGKFIFCNLAKAPHLLVAGSTGSGKSVCLNILILSIIYKSSPEDVRLVLVDPKRVEFAIYEGLPHLMLPNIITEPEKAVNAFTWAINEMEKRYTLFQSHKVKDINDYNQLPDIVNKKKPKMPYIVMIVDELADLMSVCKRGIEEKIARIAAKARAAGIHLVLATQRPSTDVITGTIKNNFPTRIAFSLTSYADSKTILDQSGAERLLGRGDMLYAPQDQNVNTRIQAPFVTGQEISQIVDYVKAHNDSNYEDNIVNKMLNKGGESSRNVGVKDPTQDEMFVPALRTVIKNNQASSSLLQRKLGVGWNRASKLIDALEDMGYISRPDSNNKRQILITKEQFRELYGDID